SPKPKTCPTTPSTTPATSSTPGTRSASYSTPAPLPRPAATGTRVNDQLDKDHPHNADERACPFAACRLGSGSTSGRSGRLLQCVGDDGGSTLWSLVRDEEHSAGDRHQGHVGSRLECGALGVGEPTVPVLLGVDDP